MFGEGPDHSHKSLKNNYVGRAGMHKAFEKMHRVAVRVPRFDLNLVPLFILI
jgi:hypothetical protein